MQIRKAQPSEAGILTHIAHQAKGYWNYPAEYIRLWQRELSFTPEYIADHPVYCAHAQNRLIGVYAASQHRGSWEIDHFWVLPEFIGTGVGRRMFNHLLNVIRKTGGKVLKIASDPNAEGFYLKMGARRVGRVPSTPAGRTLPLLEMRIPKDRKESR